MAIVESPLKHVVFVHMDSPNEPITDGWAICNGQTLGPADQDIVPNGSYTLPNLLNMYILGADPTKAVLTPSSSIASGNANTAAGAPGPGGISGANSYTLSITEIPSHTHPGSTSGAPSVTLSDSGHTHTLNDPGHIHSLNDPGHTHIASSDTVGGHVHTLNDPGHSHSLDGGFLWGDYTYPSGNVSRPIPGQDSTSSVQGRIYPATAGITLNAAGAHAHNISLATTQSGINIISHSTGITISSASSNVSGSISGLNIAVGSAGGGNAFDNRPHSFGLVPIMRVKA